MSDDVSIFKLGEIAEIGAGFSLRGAATQLNKGDVAFIQLKNVSGGHYIDWDNIEHVSLPTTRKVDYLNDGDVIFAARGTQNYAYAIPEGLPAKTVCAPQFFVLKPKDTYNILPKFLAWYLNSSNAQQHFDSVAVTSTMRNIRRTGVENLDVVLPSQSRQETIVNLWEAAIAEEKILQALISNRTQILNSIAQELSRPGAKT